MYSNLSSNKPACCHSANKTHVKDGIFKLSSIHASVIYQILLIRWIQWIPVPFRKNSIRTFKQGWKYETTYFHYYKIRIRELNLWSSFTGIILAQIAILARGIYSEWGSVKQGIIQWRLLSASPVNTPRIVSTFLLLSQRVENTTSCTARVQEYLRLLWRVLLTTDVSNWFSIVCFVTKIISDKIYTFFLSCIFYILALNSNLFHYLDSKKKNLSLHCLITDIIMEDNSLLRAKLDKKGVPEKEYYEIQTEKGYSKY